VLEPQKIMLRQSGRLREQVLGEMVVEMSRLHNTMHLMLANYVALLSGIDHGD
jgi:hypothetical protein